MILYIVLLFIIVMGNYISKLIKQKPKKIHEIPMEQMVDSISDDHIDLPVEVIIKPSEVIIEPFEEAPSETPPSFEALEAPFEESPFEEQFEKLEASSSETQTLEVPFEVPIEEQLVVIVKPAPTDFTTYLNSLWSSDYIFTRELNDLPTDIVVSVESQESFKKYVMDKYDTIKVLGNFSYTNKMEKETRLKKNELSADDLKLSYIAFKDLTLHNKINNKTMDKINKVYLSEVIKNPNKSSNDISNYRFIQVHSKPLKLLDKLWCLKIVNCVKTLNTNIFKSNLLKGINDSTIITAAINTQSRENVVLIDIERAFDSCEYFIIEELLVACITRKTNDATAKIIVAQYIYILKNRELFFKDIKVDYKKGLPTGFASSNIVFSLIMEEIIYRWQQENIDNFKFDTDYIINIYVDDIYLKIKNLTIKDIITKSIIDILHRYKFKVNFEKCRADSNLQLEFFTNLEEEDLYLGIPFTRDIKKYTDIVLKKYSSTETYKSIYDKLMIEDHPDNKQIYGYFNYKLKPIMNDINLIVFIKNTILTL